MRGVRQLCLGIAAALVLAACGKDQAAAPDSPLGFVPANTPYLFANLEPMPGDVTEAWMKRFESIGDLYTEILNDAASKLSAEKPDATETKVMLALMEEMKGKFNTAGLESIGFSVNPTPRFAAYGIGLVPVMRAELKDAAAFEAFIGRVETRVGKQLDRGKVGEQSYYRVHGDDGKLEIIFAVQGKQVIYTVTPTNPSEPLLRQLLGLDAPAERYDAANLASFNKTRGFLPYGSGFVDVTRLTTAILDDKTGIEKEFLAALDVESKPTTPECREEYLSIAAHFPLLSMGYDQYDAQRMSWSMSVETDAALAGELKGLTAPVPNLGKASEAAMQFGVSVDLDKLSKFVEAKAAAVAAAPYKCESLTELNEGFAEMRKQVGNPMVFAMAPVLKGVYVQLSDFNMSDMAAPKFAGKIVVASDNPKALIQLMGNGVPQLNQLNLTPGGAPVPLPPEMAPPTLPPAHIALAEKALGVSLGAGEETSLVEFINAPAGDQRPLLSVGYSGAVLAAMSDTVKMAAAAETDEQKRAEGERAAELMRKVYGEMFKRLDSEVLFTDRGIVVHQNAQMH